MRRRSKQPEIPGNYQHNALYHGPVSQRLWHREKLNLLKEFLKYQNFKTICDAGCGSGMIADYLSTVYPNVKITGLDIKEDCIEFAKNQYSYNKNLKFYTYDLCQEYNSEFGTFDFVYSTEVIEHLSEKDIVKYLKTIKSLGKEGATYLLTTPDCSSLWPLLEWGIDFLRLTPRMQEQHKTAVTKKSLEKILIRAGFEGIRMGNFCGLSPFISHLFPVFGRLMQKRSHWRGTGFLIWCIFRDIIKERDKWRINVSGCLESVKIDTVKIKTEKRLTERRNEK